MDPRVAQQIDKDWAAGALARKAFAERVLPTWSRQELRERLRTLRIASVYGHCPASIQLMRAGITYRRIYAEYRRRGWKIPKRTHAESRF